jgi:hypothetical protein
MEFPPSPCEYCRNTSFWSWPTFPMAAMLLSYCRYGSTLPKHAPYIHRWHHHHRQQTPRKQIFPSLVNNINSYMISSLQSAISNPTSLGWHWEWSFLWLKEPWIYLKSVWSTLHWEWKGCDAKLIPPPPTIALKMTEGYNTGTPTTLPTMKPSKALEL